MPTETKYEQLYEQRHPGITRVVGPITPAVIDKLRDEVATIAATTKTYSYPQGQVFGLVAAIIPEAKYQVLINDPTFTYTSVERGRPSSVRPSGAGSGSIGGAEGTNCRQSQASTDGLQKLHCRPASIQKLRHLCTGGVGN